MFIIYFIIFFVCYIYNNNNKIICFFSKKILYILGYKLINITEKLPSKIIIIGSHTSIYDFIIGLLFYYTVLHKKYSTYVFMKKSFERICKPILNIIDEKFKLISVEDTKKGLTNEICNNLKNKDNYVIFISPEGTRKCTEKIRTGYWYIAKNLDIDIMYVGINFLEKTITMEEYRKPYDTWEKELDYFINNCKKHIPLYPERCFWTKDYYNK